MRTRNTVAWSAAGALAVLGGVAYRAFRQGLFGSDDPSLQAWRDFDAHVHSGVDRLIAAGVLAASPHNTQPWRFGVSDAQILLYADFDRKLGAMDPFEREMFIGLGCALENITIAAPGVGFSTTIELTPGPTREVAARITLQPSEARPHRLEPAIARRRTNRGAYDTSRQIGAAVLHELQREAANETFELRLFSCESTEAARFAALTVQATRDIIADNAMSRDSALWYRQNQGQINATCDGLTMQTQGLSRSGETLVRLLPRAPEQWEHALWLKNTRDVQLPTAAQFGMILVPTDRLFDDALSLSVGRAWQRMHLAATLRGIACQPLNQIPERISREHQLGCEPGMQRAVADQLLPSGVLPTFCFRMGFPVDEASHSPRRSVERPV